MVSGDEDVDKLKITKLVYLVLKAFSAGTTLEFFSVFSIIAVAFLCKCLRNA